MQCQAEITQPPGENGIAAWLVGLAQARGAHPMLEWAPFDGTGRTWTYEQFLADVQKLAAGLRQSGIKRDDRVLVHLDNCPEALLLRFACGWIGAVCVATNTTATHDELAYLAGASRAVCAVTQGAYADLVARAGAALQWIAVLGEQDSSSSDSGRMIDFQSLRAEPIPPQAVEAGQAASIMFTTGTTARPKGVVWTHENVLWAARLNARQQGIRPDDIHLVFLPLFHVVGLSWAVLATMAAGGTIVLQPRFSRQRYWEAALHHRATIGSHVNFTTSVLSAESVPAHDFRLWLNPRRDADLERHFRVPFIAGWGMTEVLCQVIVAPRDSVATTGSIGHVSAAYDVRVEDDEGQPVSAPGVGHLLVRGAQGVSIFKEYDGDPGATQAAFDKNGFFATGDRVRLAEDGSVFFEDRLKDIIKVGGENVSAAEVESVISSCPGVKEVAVVAKPDQVYGEIVVAFVVPLCVADPETVAQLVSGIKAQCEARLSRFKRPRQLFVIESLPRVGVGKVAKATLRKCALDLSQDGPVELDIQRSALQ